MKLLLILASLGKPSQIRDVSATAVSAGFRIPKSWNVSARFKSMRGLAIRTPAGWEITKKGRQALADAGLATVGAGATQVAVDLRVTLSKINDPETHSYVDEGIRCYEAKCFRAAVVMTWLAAIDILKKEAFRNHLSSLNAEIRRINPKWKDAKVVDGLDEIKEFDFLERIHSIGIIGKNVKQKLQECLKTRNSCGHPNSFKIGQNAVASHIEILLLNVFNKFC